MRQRIPNSTSRSPETNNILEQPAEFLNHALAMLHLCNVLYITVQIIVKD
jgi:hypothetical protein